MRRVRWPRRAARPASAPLTAAPLTKVLPTVVLPTVVLLAAALLAAALAPPRPAWAHDRLLSTNPPASATVTTPITEVTLTFDEPVRQRFSTVVVDGRGGRSYERGPVRIRGSTVHQPVYPLPPGPYTVRWRVVSADGHPVEGSFRFTVALPARTE